MRKLFNPFHFLITMLLSARGMGTLDRSSISYNHPFKDEGRLYTVRGTRTAGPAPIPGNRSNQRQRRKLVRQMA